ncbi:MAG: sigma-70 family RNA polymerase sigma factor, partial [Myxococcota bacterium]
MGSTRSDVLAARAGDAAAFARLVHHTAPTVCAITTAILGNPIAGEEVGQEVFVCAWQGLGALRDPDQFEAWIRGIARNRARDALRSRLQRREVTGDALTQLADPAPDPADTLDGAEREAAVWAALDALDVEDREVLILYYREGQSVDEVARRLALTGPAVRKRMSRARARGGSPRRRGCTSTVS